MLSRYKWAVNMLFFFALFACADMPTDASDNPSQYVEQVVIEPRAVNALPPRATRRFSARVVWSDGIDRHSKVVYMATGGQIDTAGNYVAPQSPGHYQVIARDETSLRADTAQVEVLPATLSTLIIAPGEVTSERGSSVQFSVTGTFSDGTDSIPEVNWSASGGANITSSGRYTAPSTPGTYRVYATHRGGTVRDTARVTVVAPTLTGLSISPKTVSLSSSGIQYFTASAEWSDGSSALPSLAWTHIGGGTINSQGRYVAPQSAGTYRVVVASGSFRDTATVTVTAAPAPTVTAFSISPKTVQLQTGENVTLSHSAIWSDGASRSVGVTYQATGGTMNGSRYTAGTSAGSFRIIATCDCGRADTASVTIQPATLTSLSITPAQVTLNAGQTRTFQTSATWSNGSTSTSSVIYSATGGSVNSSSGVYTAPQSSGTYRVIARINGQAIRDTAVVVVNDVASSPPPPPPPTVPPPPPTTGDFTPNLPSGLNLITDSRFENLREEQYNSDGLAYAWDGRISSDPTAPFGTTVFENFYPANHRGNGEGGAILYGRDRQKWRRMYFSVMMWVPSNYSIHTNGEKFFYPVVTTNGQTTSSTSFGWYIVGGESASSATWTLGYENQIGDPRRFQTSSVKMRKGTWQRVEFYVVMNTPGQSNGIWRVWIDGVLAVDFTNARYSNASTQSVFDGIRFTGTRGGGASSVATPAGGQIRRYNRLVYYASEQ